MCARVRECVRERVRACVCVSESMGACELERACECVRVREFLSEGSVCV